MSSSTATPEKEEINRLLCENFTKAIEGLDIYRPDKFFKDEMTVSKLRRRRLQGFEDVVGMVTLTEVDGVLRWEEGPGDSPLIRGRRRGRRGAVVGGEVVAQFKFEKLQPNDINTYLERLDDKLTPPRGLRRWMTQDPNDDVETALQPVARPAAKGKILLIVHGTFSNCDNSWRELQATTEGRDLLGRMRAHYDEVLTFDHPTVAVSPTLNALDLARLFKDSEADVDVISHSRGGLVTRWWLEAFDQPGRGRRRAVLVGSPLRGTSLASPPRLKAGLSLLTNVGRVLATTADAGSSVIPFLAVASGLIRLLSSVTGAMGKVPLIDAAVAMIPGLAGQSLISNNAELSRLNVDGSGKPPDYFAVRCNFQPKDPGWAFWKYFQKGHLVNSAADLLVFEGENDLVVDTSSMTGYSTAGELPAENVYTIPSTDRVHHTNYFRQPEVLSFIADKLQIT